MEEIPQYKIFSTHFLRDKMVQGQKIILPPQLRQILLTDTGGQRSWKSSLQQTFQLLKQTQTEMETNLKDEKNLTPKRQARLKQLKTPYLLHMHTIEDLSQPAALRKIEQLLLTSGIKETPDYQKGMLTTGLLSLEQLVHLFTQTRGIDDDHRMYILPAQRYLLIQAIFEPIIESLIFMDLAQRDAPPPKKNNNNADKKKRGKKTGEGKETGEGVFEQSLEEKIATLKKIIDEKKEKARQQEKDRPKKPLYALFNSTDFTQADVECYHQIKENFKHHIQTFTEFLYKQLEQMDWTEHLEWETAKKGKWNTPAAHKAITQDPIGLDIHKKFLYQRPSSHWEINTTFKQLHIMLMVDISGSTDSFKGTKGITNGLTTIIITALKLVEERIQQLLQTREKFINFDVVLYADGIGFSTMDNPHYQKMNHEEKAALINKKIIHLSGGTDDAT
ncbi:MAG: hypothetical protein LBG52_06530 [Candidatus Peribacteria bacterium]|jgi:hypothetical protein|nr:hypothetical protein [Candidatus Peribacteria bacterium]